MNSNRFIFGLTLFLPIILTSCHKDEIEVGTGRLTIMPTVSSVETKGTIITTDGINVSGQAIGIHAYLDDDIATATGDKVELADKTDYHFIGSASASEKLVCDGSGWEWKAVKDLPAGSSDEDKDAARPKWRADIPIRFWSYYPTDVLDALDPVITWPHKASSSETPTDAQQKVVSFTYTLPTPATAAPYKDAENQKDLLLAFNEEKRIFKNDNDIDGSNTGNSGTKNASDTYDEYLSINFHHALAAVNFDITTMEDDVEFGTEITLSNVKNSGKCTATGIPAGNKVTFEWSDLSTTTTKSYSQSFSKSDDFETLGTLPDQYIRQKTSGSKTFFMIPQKLTADTKLTIKFIFKSGGVPITREMTIGKFESTDTDYVTWEAGKIYTYRIIVGDGDYTLLDTKLDVKDWVDGSMETSF